MKEFDIDNLDSAVNEFQQTVGALSDIQKINLQLQETSARFDAAGQSIQKDAANMSALSARFSEQIQQFSEKTMAYQDQLKASFEENEKMLSQQTTDALQTFSRETLTILDKATGIQEEAAKLSTQVQEYTANTQKSIDELRIQSSNNARELRTLLSEAEARTRRELETRSAVFEQLSAELAEIKSRGRETLTIATAGTIAASIAAILSLLHFFL